MKAWLVIQLITINRIISHAFMSTCPTLTLKLGWGWSFGDRRFFLSLTNRLCLEGGKRGFKREELGLTGPRAQF